MTESVAQRKQPTIYFSRGNQHKFHAMIAEEEEKWAAMQHGRKPLSKSPIGASFEDAIEKEKAAGSI